MAMARLRDTGTCKNTECPAADCAALNLHRAMQKSAGTPDCDAPNAKIKCAITRACWACLAQTAHGRWRLRLPHQRHALTHQRTNAPKYQRSVASVARLLRGDNRDRPGTRGAVVAHGVIAGTFKNATCVIEASTRIAGYGITGRNYFGTGTRCA